MINFYSIQYLQALDYVTEVSAEGNDTFDAVVMPPLVAGTVTICLKNGYRLTSEEHLNLCLIELGIPHANETCKTTSSFYAEVYNDEDSTHENKFFQYEHTVTEAVHRSELTYNQFIDEITKIIGKELIGFLLARHKSLDQEEAKVELHDQSTIINGPQLIPAYQLLTEKSKLNSSNVDESLQSKNQYTMSCCKII